MKFSIKRGTVEFGEATQIVNDSLNEILLHLNKMFSEGYTCDEIQVEITAYSSKKNYGHKVIMPLVPLAPKKDKTQAERPYEKPGKVLAAARKKAKLNQTELAELCECTRGCISWYERGKQPIPYAKRRLLADLLHIDEVSLK